MLGAAVADVADAVRRHDLAGQQRTVVFGAADVNLLAAGIGAADDGPQRHHAVLGVHPHGRTTEERLLSA